VIYRRFHDYPMLIDRTMRDQEEQSLKEAKGSEKRATEEAGRLAKKQEGRKADLVREEAIEKALKARKAKGSEKRATEEAGHLP
jgi:hypothetical protein